MDFFAIVLFLSLYYIRPYEWLPLFGSLQLVRVSMVVAIVALLFGDRPIGWRGLFRTPSDWLMLAYFLWIIYASPEKMRAYLFIYNIFTFYWVVVLTLRSTSRILVFLNWWSVFVLFVAALALLSEVGFDPTDTYDITHGRMKDRLILNLGTYNNPNALGHSIVPGVIMLYFIGIWKRPIFTRITTPLLMALPITCIYLTQSKGAFLSAAITLVCAVSFKRPKAIQIGIVIICATLGVVAIKSLPRMQELSSSKTDEAIQGRVAAFRFGYNIVQHQFCGVGYANFTAKFLEKNHYAKSAHSSYVNIGGELGKTGLCLYLALLYYCFRVLLAAKTTTDEEERVRRILYVLLISYCVSSWMIDWHNRATYWLMIAAVAAFHRLMLDKNRAAVAAEITEENHEVAPLPALAYATPGAAPVGVLQQIAVPASQPTSFFAEVQTTNLPAAKLGIRWNRPKWYDWILMYAVLRGVIYIWHYMMLNM